VSHDALLTAVLQRAEGLPKRDVESTGVLIAAGEWVVALEALCTQLYEYDVDVDEAFRLELEELGGAFGVQVAYLLGDPSANRDAGIGDTNATVP